MHDYNNNSFVGSILISAAILVILGLAIGIVAYLVGIKPANSHSWYPFECCFGKDCGPIKDEDVKVIPGGFQYKPTGEFIKMEDAKVSKDSHYHLCRIYIDSPIRCFFYPLPST